MEVALPSRREFLRQSGLGFGSLALATLLGEERATQTPAPIAAKTPAATAAPLPLVSVNS